MLLSRLRSHLIFPTAFAVVLTGKMFGQTVTTSGYVDNSVYSVSNSDLLQTNLGSVSLSGSIAGGTGFSSNLGLLYDGNFGAAGTDYSSATGFSSGSTLTFNLDLSASPAGYSISSINTYAGWDTGRDGQSYTVSYSLVSAPTTFITLATVDPFQAGSYPPYPDARTEATITGTGGGTLATDVAAIEFTFNDYQNGGTAYREIDVNGSPLSAVPEPATTSLIFAACALGAGLFWRKAVPLTD